MEAFRPSVTRLSIFAVPLRHLVICRFGFSPFSVAWLILSFLSCRWFSCCLIIALQSYDINFNYESVFTFIKIIIFLFNFYLHLHKVYTRARYYIYNNITQYKDIITRM